MSILNFEFAIFDCVLNVIINKILGPLEQYFTVRSEKDLYKSILVSASYSTPISKPELIRAVRAVVLDNPILSANVFQLEDGCKSAWLGIVPSFDIECAIEYRYTSDKYGPNKMPEDGSIFQFTADLFPGLMNEGFSSNLSQQDKVLWKLIVLNNTEVCFIYDHCLADGMSSCFFHDSLFKKLVEFENQPLNPSSLNSKFVFSDFNPSNPLPPPIELLLDFHTSMKSLAGELWNYYAPKFLKSKKIANAWKAKPISDTREALFDLKTGKAIINSSPIYDLITLDNKSTSKILSICKEKKVTVTSFLTIAFLESILDITKSKPTQFAIAVDARRYLDVDKFNQLQKNSNITSVNNLIGCYLTDVTFNLNPVVPGNTAWEVVDELSNSIKYKIKPEIISKSDTTHELKFIDDFSEFFVKRTLEPIDETLSLSNLGYRKFVATATHAATATNAATTTPAVTVTPAATVTPVVTALAAATPATTPAIATPVIASATITTATPVVTAAPVAPVAAPTATATATATADPAISNSNSKSKYHVERLTFNTSNFAYSFDVNVITVESSNGPVLSIGLCAGISIFNKNSKFTFKVVVEKFHSILLDPEHKL